MIENIHLPKNAETVKDYYDHMQASTRIYREEREEYIWTEGTKPDHFFHAEAYAHMARRLLANL
jgi:hypothetical protein